MTSEVKLKVRYGPNIVYAAGVLPLGLKFGVDIYFDLDHPIIKRVKMIPIEIKNLGQEKYRLRGIFPSLRDAKRGENDEFDLTVEQFDARGGERSGEMIIRPDLLDRATIRAESYHGTVD